MTRRIAMGFLAVLVTLIALCVIPLGLRVTDQERNDFQQGSADTARSIADTAEDRIADTHSTGRWRPPGRPGDRVTVVDAGGRMVAHFGTPITGPLAQQVAAGTATPADATAAVALIGDEGHIDGRVLMLRSTEPLESRIHSLWLLLTLAALVALALGGIAAVLLARWIGRPLRRLRAATVAVGSGGTLAPVGKVGGPPETQSLSHAFDEMAARIRSLLEQQRAMTSEVSHQLRTPLAALRLRLELLSDDVGPSLRPELEAAQAEIARLTRLTEGLLALARAEATSSRREPADVAEAIRGRVSLWQHLADNRGVRLSFGSANTAALVTEGHLEQILDNLIANALDCLEPGRRIEITSAWEDGDVRLTVADDGEGIPPAHRGSAFVPFVGDRRGGAGLGLAIVSRLVEADGGRAQLDETAGGGLTVSLLLPGAALRDSGGREVNQPKDQAVDVTSDQPAG